MTFHGLLLAGATMGAAMLGLSSPKAAVGGAIILSNNVLAVDVNQEQQSDAVVFNGTSIPTSRLVEASAGSSYSRIQVDYTASASGTTFSNDLSQRRDGDFFAFTNGLDNSMLFTVDANTSYSLFGFYDVTDVSSAGKVRFHSTLMDVSASNALLFESAQESLSTMNESFVLGGAGGDSININSGSLTGTLIAGHSYAWFFQAFMQARPTADDGASALGNVSLILSDGGTNPVPEPTSIALFGIGAIGLIVFHRRKRRHAV